MQQHLDEVEKEFYKTWDTTPEKASKILRDAIEFSEEQRKLRNTIRQQRPIEVPAQ